MRGGRRGWTLEYGGEITLGKEESVWVRCLSEMLGCREEGLWGVTPEPPASPVESEPSRRESPASSDSNLCHVFLLLPLQKRGNKQLFNSPMT